MTPAELCRQTEQLGLTLKLIAGILVVIPRDRCPEEFAQTLREHKAELVAWLNRTPCPGWQAVPPPELPLNPDRPGPAREDARAIMDYLIRQIGSLPSRLCEWCLKRELAYLETFQWPDQICTYASARDAACWQLNRNEKEVWEFLEATNEVAATCRNKPPIRSGD
jgi:hypothetical protein